MKTWEPRDQRPKCRWLRPSRGSMEQQVHSTGGGIRPWLEETGKAQNINRFWRQWQAKPSFSTCNSKADFALCFFYNSPQAKLQPWELEPHGPGRGFSVPYKHEDPSLDPWDPHKSWVRQSLPVTPVLEGQRPADTRVTGQSA